jgi:predicted ABC-type ATPase
MKKPIFQIFAGANGSGKSTLAQQYLEKHPMPFVNADEIAKKLQPTHVDAVRIKAGKTVLKNIEILFKTQTSFSIESTLSGNYLQKMISKALNLGYSIKILYIFLDDSVLNIGRVQARVLAGGHSIPREDIIRRYYRSRFLFWHKYRSLCHDWTLFYNGQNGFEETAYGNQSEYEIVDEALFSLFLKDTKENAHDTAQ